jgi:hypothetical protein
VNGSHVPCCICIVCLLLLPPATDQAGLGPAHLHSAYCPSLLASTDCRAALTLYAASQVLAVVLAAKGKQDEAADSLAKSVKGAALVEAHCAVRFMQESLFPGRCLPGRRCVQQGAPLGGCTPRTRVCMHGLQDWWLLCAHLCCRTGTFYHSLPGPGRVPQGSIYLRCTHAATQHFVCPPSAVSDQHLPCCSHNTRHQ